MFEERNYCIKDISESEFALARYGYFRINEREVEMPGSVSAKILDYARGSAFNLEIKDGEIHATTPWDVGIEDTITFDTSQKSVCIESRMGRPWIGGDELEAIYGRAKELGI